MKVHELFAYLHVNDAAKAITFYQKAFGQGEIPAHRTERTYRPR
jgi:uncharacterized glyoxalase superfamily protein PhnB